MTHQPGVRRHARRARSGIEDGELAEHCALRESDKSDVAAAVAKESAGGALHDDEQLISRIAFAEHSLSRLIDAALEMLLHCRQLAGGKTGGDAGFSERHFFLLLRA